LNDTIVHNTSNEIVVDRSEEKAELSIDEKAEDSDGEDQGGITIEMFLYHHRNFFH
jgi:hypothetical protein